MAWQTNTILDWGQFVSLTGAWSVGDPIATPFLHRGQSDATWSLAPSLKRALAPDIAPERALQIESALLRDFKSRAHIHHDCALLPGPKAGAFAWWRIMQHYGAPTRMLDWTRSPFVAAYFAVADRWDSDGAVWTMYPSSLLKTLEGTTVDAFEKSALSPTTSHGVLVLPMSTHSDRTVAQQGHFTVAANVLADHGLLVDSLHAGSPVVPRKVIIPKALKPAFLRELSTMNVSAAALFPGADGLGRWMSELARLASAHHHSP